MQLLPRYLLKNRINLVANLAGFVVEYRPVYQRQVQVYKGIDNVIEFRLLNADQKPVDTSLYTPKFVAFDENKNLVLNKTCDVLDDGSTATKGLFSVKLLENDLLSIKGQYLSFAIYLETENENIITYSSSHFENNGVIKLSPHAFPGPKESKTIVEFYDSNSQDTIYYSETVDAEPNINGNTGLHTAVIYAKEFFGTVTVQVTLDNQLDDADNWADIETIEFDGEEVEPKFVNFNGVFRWIRFKVDSNPSGKISKILLRN